MYIHELKGWPAFTWDGTKVGAKLSEVRHAQGRLVGRLESIGFNLQREATLESLTQEVLKTSEIEGERLDLIQVRSSVARRLGIDVRGAKNADRDTEGIVDLMLDATRQYDQPLTTERLFRWHARLFPTKRSNMRPIRVGDWRDDHLGPMQVVSGAAGHERVHYEAPAASKIPKEMNVFQRWYNTDQGLDLVLKAALAHFWFVTLHPFDDGNGRLARAIGEMMLARSEKSAQRFYSLSAQIMKERDEYYDILEQTQKGSVDVTPWMNWFLSCFDRALLAAKETLDGVLTKARFWQRVEEFSLNERQRIVLKRLLDGFQGKLTTSKWAKLAKSSQDTALRDILDLVEKGVLIKNPQGGRSTSYEIRKPE